MTILFEYVDIADNFSKNLVTEFSEYTRINNHIINLIKGEQLPYRLIHVLKPIEIEILKTYIKTNLTNNFIRSFKSPLSLSIFFVKKANSSLWLYVNY